MGFQDFGQLLQRRRWVSYRSEIFGKRSDPTGLPTHGAKIFPRPPVSAGGAPEKNFLTLIFPKLGGRSQKNISTPYTTQGGPSTV